jgi:hypothetical protein
VLILCPCVFQDSDAVKDKAEPSRGKRSDGHLEPFAAAAIAVRTLVACVRPSLGPSLSDTHDAEGEVLRERKRSRKALLSMARDLDDVVLSFIVQGQGGATTLDSANSKSPGWRTVLGTLEMRRFGQYVCVSATDDSSEACDPDAGSNSGDDTNTNPHAKSLPTPNIGYLGVKIFRIVLGPSSCPLFIPTPLRVYALLALVRSTALQKPQVRSGPILPLSPYNLLIFDGLVFPNACIGFVLPVLD